MKGFDGLKRFYAFFPLFSTLRDQNVYLSKKRCSARRTDC